MKRITEQQYYKALGLIKAYQEQITKEVQRSTNGYNIPNNRSLRDLPMSGKLKNGIYHYLFPLDYHAITFSDIIPITPSELLLVRFVGIKTIDEFKLFMKGNKLQEKDS